MTLCPTLLIRVICNIFAVSSYNKANEIQLSSGGSNIKPRKCITRSAKMTNTHVVRLSTM